MTGPALAVMIDNLPEARPQSGLDRAEVIYEAPAEGGIPRLLAVFLGAAGAEQIGPVRSTRHYFVYLAAEYRVPLVHIGASPQGFATLQETGLERIDETRGDGGFRRDSRRSPPHDAFVGTESIRAELARRGATVQPTAAGLVFGEVRPGNGPATRLRIAYPGAAGYTVHYDYEAGARTYLRSMDGQPHLDGDSGRRYGGRSIIVQLVAARPIPNDEAGRLDVDVIGNGRGLLVAEGTQAPLQWNKASAAEPTRFQRQDGAPFALPQGQVWIQLVPTEGGVEVS